MRDDPCSYCGLPKMSYSRLDTYSQEIVRETKDHACAHWATKPVLTSTPADTNFISASWNTAEGLVRYREGLR